MSITNQNELMRYIEPTIRGISSATPFRAYWERAFNSSKPTGTQTPTSSTQVETDWAAKYKEAEDLKTADINAATTERDGATTKVTADYDATVDRLNASYDRAANLLKSKYLGQLKRLEIAKSQSEQTANINYQKLLKYLPERLSAQGLSGLGTSQGAYIRATNDLNNRLVDVMGKYTEGRTAADNEYSAGLTSIEDTRAEGIQAADDRKSRELQAIADRYLSRETAANSRYDTKVAALDNYKVTMDANEAALNVQNAKELLEGGYFDTSEDVSRWYNDNKGTFGNSEEYIKSMVDSVVNDMKNLEAEKEELKKLIINTSPRVSFKGNGWGGWKSGDTFHVNYIDNEGKSHDQSLTSLGVINGQTLDSMKTDSVAKNTLFIFDGKMYFKNNNGDVVLLDANSYSDDYKRIYKVVEGSKK